MIEEISRIILLDLAHSIEDLIEGKPVLILATSEQISFPDFLFSDELYPVDEDRDFLESGEIFIEDI